MTEPVVPSKQFKSIRRTFVNDKLTNPGGVVVSNSDWFLNPTYGSTAGPNIAFTTSNGTTATYTNAADILKGS